ncbi:MAG: PH domain-containing protein [Spirochaetes bacterium]|nr:PH domain-containing protein [Spirochaetota bacterium]
MIKMLHLLNQVIQYQEVKKLLKYHQQNKIQLLYILTFIYSLLFLAIISLPLFVIHPNKIFLSLIILAVSLLLSIPIVIRQMISMQKKEKLDHKLLNMTPVFDDFIYQTRNNLKDYLDFSFLISTGINIIQLFFFIITAGWKNHNFLFNSLFLVSYLIGTTLIILLFTYITFYRKKNQKESLLQLENYPVSTNIFFFLIPASAIFGLLFLAILWLVSHSLLISIIISIVLSLPSTFLLHIIFRKINFYDRNQRTILLKKTGKNIKKGFISSKRFLKQIHFSKAKYLATPLIFGFTLFLMIRFFNDQSTLQTKIFQCVVFSLFFSYPIFRYFFFHAKHVLRPFLFTCFIFFLLLLFSFLVYFNFYFDFDKQASFFNLNQFIIPVIVPIIHISSEIKFFFKQVSMAWMFATPLIFTGLFYFNYVVYKKILYIERLIDAQIKKSLSRKNAAIIFGDSLSLYPFFFSFFLSIIIIILLKLELPALSRLFFNLVEVLQIREVFKFEFLSQANIDLFFNYLFYIILIYFIINLILKFISSIFSHLILFHDEIIYLSNNLIHKNVLRIPVSKINYIVIKQNLVEKFLDIGTLFVETADKNGMIEINGVTGIRDKNIIIMEKIKLDLQKA